MGKKKKVAIIGAGIAGLSAGSYLARNGFDVEIFEMHDIPGGQCTSWKNGKFTFDACVHWLIGSKEGELFNGMWKELGALDNIEIIDHDRYMSVHYPDGEKLTFYIDADKLEAELLRFSPEDSGEIRKFVKVIRYMTKMKMLEPDAAYAKKSLKSLFHLIGFIVGFIPVYKWSKISAREYAGKFKKRELSDAITNLFMPDFAMIFIFFTFAWMSQKNAGYPIGGSLNFAKNIARNCEKNGAVIRYKSRVVKILTEQTLTKQGGNDKVSGVELENGNIIEADYVISAADSKATIDQMLAGKYSNPKIKKAWEVLPLFEPLFFISLGLNGDSGTPPSVTGSGLKLKHSVDTGNKKIDWVLLHSLDFDPTLAPKGKSVVEILCLADFDYWNDLKNSNKEKYKKEKQRIANEIIENIDRDFLPGLKNKTRKSISPHRQHGFAIPAFTAAPGKVCNYQKTR
ncbi:MAG: NAD(P)/FAD-dependent oxidoreductase [Leptospirales bacterium]